MRELSSKELMNVTGGFSFGIGLLIAIGLSFLIGVFDGYVRPLKCN